MKKRWRLRTCEYIEEEEIEAGGRRERRKRKEIRIMKQRKLFVCRLQKQQKKINEKWAENE
jgi:hypothetical protein